MNDRERNVATGKRILGWKMGGGVINLIYNKIKSRHVSVLVGLVVDVYEHLWGLDMKLCFSSPGDKIEVDTKKGKDVLHSIKWMRKSELLGL